MKVLLALLILLPLPSYANTMTIKVSVEVVEVAELNFEEPEQSDTANESSPYVDNTPEDSQTLDF